jgi:hypothetical protein
LRKSDRPASKVDDLLGKREDVMIVEERIYTLFLGKVPEYARLMEEGIAIQEPILGHLFGYFSTEVGPLNQVIHMWAYENLEERARRRAQLMENPDWLQFLTRLRPLIESQENRILIPMSFSPPLRVKAKT